MTERRLQPVQESEERQAHPERAISWKQGGDEGGFPDPLLELIAARFRLLGEPLRLKLLGALTGGERSVGELVALTGASQPNVSKHLAALMQGGLVRRRKAGTSIYYALADPSVLTLCDIVCAGVQERFASLAQALQLGTASQPAESRPTELSEQQGGAEPLPSH
ncbi:ArsR/SmtB family transcription factor [Thermogemmatispora sp.]|uniref:ArsR/SmtB family transcription factor n=1 Tax=Thermogemmatispora sp. TaxID=1968838 RepID=UPI0035E3F8C3